MGLCWRSIGRVASVNVVLLSGGGRQRSECNTFGVFPPSFLHCVCNHVEKEGAMWLLDEGNYTYCLA